MDQTPGVINQQLAFGGSADEQEKLLRMKKHPRARRFPDPSPSVSDRSGEEIGFSFIFSEKRNYTPSLH